MHTVDELSLQDYFQGKKHFYQFLQKLFFEPMTEEMVMQLREYGNLHELLTMDEGGQYLYHFFEQATKLDLPGEKDEFNRLFMGPGEILAPPWESVYRSREHLVFDDITFQVRDKYHHFGLQYVKENNEPDDHLVVELDFLIFLNKKGLEETDSTEQLEFLDKQLEFLEEHLCQWIPDFCQMVLKHTDSPLYKGAALLLRDFIELDVQSLREMKEAMVHGR